MSGAAVEPARRIVIIGRMGSGKSTLGTRLAEELALPIIHLSKHLKDAGERTGDAEQRRRIQGLTAGREWIIEGSYFRVVDLLFAAATVVVILDVPMHRALARFLRRERSRVNHGWEPADFARSYWSVEAAVLDLVLPPCRTASDLSGGTSGRCRRAGDRSDERS